MYQHTKLEHRAERATELEDSAVLHFSGWLLGMCWVLEREEHRTERITELEDGVILHSIGLQPLPSEPYHCHTKEQD
jgi:hypothetical protein